MTIGDLCGVVAVVSLGLVFVLRAMGKVIAARDAEISDLTQRLSREQASVDRLLTLANPHEATRAEWKRTASQNIDLRESKAALRRRLRGVLWQARAWKAEAVARGWERAAVNADRSALKALRREAKARGR